MFTSSWSLFLSSVAMLTWNWFAIMWGDAWKLQEKWEAGKNCELVRILLRTCLIFYSKKSFSLEVHLLAWHWGLPVLNSSFLNHQFRLTIDIFIQVLLFNFVCIVSRYFLYCSQAVTPSFWELTRILRKMNGICSGRLKKTPTCLVLKCWWIRMMSLRSMIRLGTLSFLPMF